MTLSLRRFKIIAFDLEGFCDESNFFRHSHLLLRHFVSLEGPVEFKCCRHS